MVYAPDFTHDLELAVYGLQTFTLKVQDSSDVVLTKCVQREPTTIMEPEPMGGQVKRLGQAMVWPSHLSPNEPPLGSVLVDGAGTYWTILRIIRREITDTWQAFCLNLSINSVLDNQATVLRGVYGKGKANEAKTQWHGYFSGRRPPTAADVIPARFQPSMEDAMIRFSGEWTREVYRVLLAKKLPIELAGGEYRLQDSSGAHYRITHYAAEQCLDRLPVAICVRITEGREFARPGAPGQLPPPTFPTQS